MNIFSQVPHPYLGPTVMDQSEQSRQIKALLVDKTDARLALACVQMYSALIYTVVLAQSV